MATKITLKNLPTGYQTLITNGKHALVGDEPVASKGTDLGFSPPEFLLTALATCKASTVRYIARRNNWEIGDVDAELEQTVKRGEGGKLSTSVKVAIKINGGNLTEEQKTELLKQADACYVHRMIEGDWNIESAVELEETVEA